MLLMTLLPLVGWAGVLHFSITGAKGAGYGTTSISVGDLENLKLYIDDVNPGSYETELQVEGAQWYFSETAKSEDADWGNPMNGTPNGAGYFKAIVDKGLNTWVGVLTVSAPTDDTTQGDATQVELQVTPVSGQSFPYQTPIDQIVVGANMVSITVNPAQANPFLDEADEGRSIIAQYLKIDNAAELSAHQVGEANYRFAAKTQEELDAEFGTGAKTAGKIVKDGVTYYIKPILSGVINIVAGENELLNFGTADKPVYAFAPITGIPYDGKAQDLVAGTVYDFATFGAAEGDENPYGTGQALFIGQETVDEGADAVTYTGIRVLSNKPANDNVVNANDFVGQTFYVKATRANGIPTGRLQLYTKNGDAFTAVQFYAEISAADVSWAKYTGPEDKGVQFYYISKKNFEAGQ